MTTIRSPKEFSRVLGEKLLELMWSQWRTLGISAHGSESVQLLDLEALILATEAAGALDRRLMASSREWRISFREWINLSRLKRMGSEFIGNDVFLKQPLIEKARWESFLADLDPFPPMENREDRINRERDGSVVTPPRLKKPSLGQLCLRGIFGVNARAEIYLYLSLEGKGNSTQIARKISTDQKNVYRILERWAETGLVVRESRLKENLYSLAPHQRLWRPESENRPFWSWKDLFLLFSRLSAASSIHPWAEDVYLFSSLFRDLHPNASVIASSANFSLPDPSLHAGSAYFSPFAEALLKFLDGFLGSKERSA